MASNTKQVIYRRKLIEWSNPQISISCQCELLKLSRSGLYSVKHLGYANARTMKVLANTIINNAYLRISHSSASDDKNRIIQSDIALFVWNENAHFYQQRKTVGFVRN